jgi:hypothetical protein
MKSECNRIGLDFTILSSFLFCSFVSSDAIGKRPRFPCKGNGVSSNVSNLFFFPSPR